MPRRLTTLMQNAAGKGPTICVDLFVRLHSPGFNHPRPYLVLSGQLFIEEKGDTSFVDPVFSMRNEETFDWNSPAARKAYAEMHNTMVSKAEAIRTVVPNTYRIRVTQVPVRGSTKERTYLPNERITPLHAW